MKKVAVCLKGAVTKIGGTHDRFYNKGDLYRQGHYIDYKAVKNSLQKHLINANKNYSFDFFLHGWNVDLQEDLINLYKPKRHLFEDNRNYNEVISSIINRPEDFGGVSGGLSTKKSLELRELYEIECKERYNIIIVYRYDVLLWKDIILDDYTLDHHIYVNAWDGSCNTDFHFIMSWDNAYKFKYLYDSIALQNNKHGFHYWIKNYVVNIMGINMREDDIKAGIDQEHMRVIGNIPSLQSILKNYT